MQLDAAENPQSMSRILLILQNVCLHTLQQYIVSYCVCGHFSLMLKFSLRFIYIVMIRWRKKKPTMCELYLFQFIKALTDQPDI